MNPQPDFEQYKKDQEKLEEIPTIQVEFYYTVNDISQKMLEGGILTDKEIDDLEIIYDMTQDLEKEIIAFLDTYRSQNIISKEEFLIVSNFFLIAHQHGPNSETIKNIFLDIQTPAENLGSHLGSLSVPRNISDVITSVYSRIQNSTKKKKLF